MAERCLTFMWDSFDPSKLNIGSSRNRGQLASKCNGLSTSERQAAGGQYSASQRRKKSVEALAAAFNRLDGLNTELTIAQVIEASKVSRSTAYSVGMEAIISAAKILRMAETAQKKTSFEPTGKDPRQAENSFFDQACPRRCLVKRDSFTGRDTRTDQGINSHIKPQMEVNTDQDLIMSMGGNTDNNKKIAPETNENTTFELKSFKLRQKCALERVSRSISDKSIVSLNKTFVREMHEAKLMYGSAMYHYITASVPASVKIFVRNRTYS